MKKKTIALTSIVTLIPMIVGIIIWSKLPDSIAVHFNMAGEANRFAGKVETVFGLPIFLLAVNLLCIFTTSLDKRKDKIGKKMNSILIWICPLISLIVGDTIYLKALGYSVDIPLIALFIIAAVEIVIGNYLPKCRQNDVVGIRVPWTMKSEKNWNRTHRFGGRIYFAAGLITVICAVLKINYGVLLLMNILVLFSPIAYSFAIKNSLQ